MIADITSPPKKPISAITSAIAPACHGENGVIHHSAAPSAVALATPPTKPSTVLDGDSSGAILRLPHSLPHTYCSTSLPCTTITRKAISSRLRPSKPGIGSVSSAGTCEMQNTQIITAHCTPAQRSRKRVVSDDSAARIGRIRKA
ncbi:hypothetical protein D3C72_1961340 [compost metagenome]